MADRNVLSSLFRRKAKRAAGGSAAGDVQPGSGASSGNGAQSASGDGPTPDSGTAPVDPPADGNRAAADGSSANGNGRDLDALRQENRKLRRAVEELTTLNDLSRAIGASFNSQEVINKIVKRSMQAVRAEQAVITLIDREEIEEMKTLIRVRGSDSESESFHLDQALRGCMLTHKRPMFSNDPFNDERLRGVPLAKQVRSLLCVPLMIQSEVIGVLTAYNKKDTAGFGEEDQRLLAIIGSQSAQVIENARLHEEQKEMEFLHEQIRLARNIQLSLLPDAAPELDGYELAGRSIPAQDVGGDYFDFIPIDDDRLALCLGDVSGKGLPASLLMANLQATLRGQTLLDAPVGDCIGRSNVLLYNSTDDEKFATLFYGVLDLSSHRLRFCNAGHEHPMLVSAGAEGTPVARLATEGLILGILPEFTYREDVIGLQSGDVLVVYSDGVSDAENTQQEPYGEDTLRSLIQEHRDESAAVILEHIVTAVNEHAGEAPQLDDITVVVLKRK